jgi:hypothetical protein
VRKRGINAWLRSDRALHVDGREKLVGAAGLELTTPSDQAHGKSRVGDKTMSLGLILVIILVFILLGGFSGRFGGYGYGYGHGGVGLIGTILIIVVILMLIGRI